MPRLHREIHINSAPPRRLETIMTLKAATPVLRIFDEAKACEFYCDFLGFSVDWTHRYGDNFPLYMQVRRGGCVLHLTGHHTDCTPGSALRIEAEDIESYHAELNAKDYKFARPGLDETPWGTRDMRIVDPFGNTLTFFRIAPTQIEV
jgi:uncharacterized glyoxalase superfamily protein PhnB